MFNPESLMVVARTLAGDGRAGRRTTRAPRKRRADVTVRPAAQAATGRSSRLVLVVLGQVPVARSRARRGRVSCSAQLRRSTSSRGAPDPDARAHGARAAADACRPAAPQRRQVELPAGDAEQPHHQRVRAEAAITETC